MSPLLPWVLALTGSLRADPVMGVEYVPLGRGDLTWVEEDRLSGTAVGEFDGLLQPPLTFRGGVGWGEHVILGGVAVARITTTATTDEVWSQEHSGALRLSVDYRRILGLPEPGGIRFFLEGGAYGVIPSARLVSSAYTDQEQADADQTASTTRAVIGGGGGRVGPGFAYTFAGGLSVGAVYHLGMYCGQSVIDDTLTVSTLVVSEAALIFEARPR